MKELLLSENDSECGHEVLDEIFEDVVSGRLLRVEESGKMDVLHQVKHANQVYQVGFLHGKEMGVVSGCGQRTSTDMESKCM